MRAAIPKKPPPWADSLVLIGGPVDEVTVTLRVMGDDLDPDEVTRQLGVQPTRSRKKGQSLKSGHISRSGIWMLEGNDPKPTPLDEQIDHLLARMTDDLTVWTALSKRFRMDVYCGLFVATWSRGESVSLEIMKKLVDRGTSLGLDIYGPDESMPSKLKDMRGPGAD